jgi:proteasome lid subunit RPN8/RPN11
LGNDVAMKVAISSGLVERILALAAAQPTQEVCGLLLGQGDRIDNILPARNVATDPHRTFEVDPTVLVNALRTARAGGPAVIGCYHSHPLGNAMPSAMDASMIGRVGEYWLICHENIVRGWQAATRRSFVEVYLVPQPSACVTS